MDYYKVVILGIVQGLTEFLPISSSGHLALIDKLYPGQNADVLFYTIVHLGTMLATFVVFWPEIVKILFSLKEIPRAKRTKKLNDSQKMCVYIVLASIPTGIAGVILKERFEALTHNIPLIGMMLILTGCLLFLTKFAQQGQRQEHNFGYLHAFIIGCAQGFAIFPGVSRSGLTIATILFLKGERQFAGRFSFLMSLPAILAANLLEFSHLGKGTVTFSAYHLWGFVIAFVTGLLALKFLLKIVQKGKFYYFSYYCFLIGVSVLFFLAK